MDISEKPDTIRLIAHHAAPRNMAGTVYRRYCAALGCDDIASLTADEWCRRHQKALKRILRRNGIDSVRFEPAERFEKLIREIP